ncbi:hypothetical protein OV090_25645 [Nannocystis sp. RBIL2]|uniref:hypothetical protein n=1 Tax=Nannocystis sp. RBIL2 TaxID=2996788 RepID=UPI002271957A|nr:hypothetical protein [Nannocystis sp. RBIL2]MCY1068152.1 hypothetical protein [Nannocystis sp. RBIL2]
MRPPLAARTAATSSARPCTKRSSPIRSSGPLGTSRIPVASTTSAPGSPAAKRAYQAITSGVTRPSSEARHGTIAGTQVRACRRHGPTSIGENHRLAAASSALGQRAGGIAWRILSGGVHMASRL